MEETLEVKFNRLDKQLAELLYQIDRLKDQAKAVSELVYELIPPPIEKSNYGELFGKEKELDL
mgnify:CR=1 FL=1